MHTTTSRGELSSLDLELVRERGGFAAVEVVKVVDVVEVAECAWCVGTDKLVDGLLELIEEWCRML